MQEPKFKKIRQFPRGLRKAFRLLVMVGEVSAAINAVDFIAHATTTTVHVVQAMM